MMKVGIVGWRGMVGSVLVQRMREERDFDHIDPVFFSTSQAGASGPAIGRATEPVASATDVASYLEQHGAAEWIGRLRVYGLAGQTGYFSARRPAATGILVGLICVAIGIIGVRSGNHGNAA